MAIWQYEQSTEVQSKVVSPLQHFGCVYVCGDAQRETPLVSTFVRSPSKVPLSPETHEHAAMFPTAPGIRTAASDHLPLTSMYN